MKMYASQSSQTRDRDSLPMDEAINQSELDLHLVSKLRTI
jgi:hypothetical protein